MEGGILVKVVADYREKGSKFAESLRNYDILLEFRRLDIGDYVVSDRVVVERKTAEDFCSSIIDGRIFKQAKKMKAYESPVVLVTEGEITIRPSSYAGAISSLVLDYGIPVVVLPDDVAPQFLYRLAYREQSENVRRIGIRNSKPESLLERQAYFLAGLPGINTELAERILREFGPPIEFLVSPEKSRIRGLGSKKIKSIEETLTKDMRGDFHERRGKNN